MRWALNGLTVNRHWAISCAAPQPYLMRRQQSRCRKSRDDQRHHLPDHVGGGHSLKRASARYHWAMTPLVDKSYSKDDVEAIIVRHDAEKARDAREKAISEGFDKMSMRLDAANHAKAEVADRIAQQTVVITAVQGDVGQVKVDVAGVKDDVAALQGKVGPLLQDYTFNLH